jgi:hypothetical protein
MLSDVTDKRCSKCGDTKSAAEFSKNKACKDGLSAWCLLCNRENTRIWRLANKDVVNQKARDYRQTERGKANVDKHNRANRFKRYGITEEDYQAMVADQGGVCKICGQPPSDRMWLDIDHDHETGKVRGLLCSQCNTAIGLLREDPEVLAAAALYLKAA